ncbi:MAG: T9SS type A sorting domain-containing protein, partial [Bacteroidales bacterium]|nr:T9SS type A sorting domain-containing protein [Bacteroidales bacterium]
TDAATSGNVVITFSEAMDEGAAGTVQLNSLSALTGGAWSDGNTVFTVAYSGLTNSTAYTVNISGFEDAAGNTMTADNTHSFTTGASAQTPAITAHPQPATYAAGATATALTVTASVSDGGTLSYQWYRNTTDSNTDGTPITGATDVAYTPPTATAGTTYYYVVVTNTNNSVSGTQTATAASNTAAVTVNTSGTSTGVGETLKADISAYPNPFRGTLHLVGAEGCTLTVFTSTGALVHTQKLTAADETIHLEHLPTGLYLFRLEKDGKTKTIKIVNRE